MRSLKSQPFGRSVSVIVSGDKKEDLVGITSYCAGVVCDRTWMVVDGNETAWGLKWGSGESRDSRLRDRFGNLQV